MIGGRSWQETHVAFCLIRQLVKVLFSEQAFSAANYDFNTYNYGNDQQIIPV
jgi:hypothetical protein